MKRLLSAALAATMLTTPALAAEVKIGFVTTLTTGAAIIGNDMKNAVELAVEHMGGKMGDLDVNVIFGDDGFKPETGKQVTDKLVKQDDVDFVAGYIWACPPLKGDDYIIYCHPDSQMIPKSERLRTWYHKMIDRAVAEGIVVERTNIYDEHMVVKPRARCVRHVLFCLLASSIRSLFFC